MNDNHFIEVEKNINFYFADNVGTCKCRRVRDSILFITLFLVHEKTVLEKLTFPLWFLHKQI